MMQSGDKAASKGFFRQPDWDLAAGYYSDAATSFKTARSFEQAVDAYTKASEAYFKTYQMHLAGMAMENVGFILIKNLNRPQRGAEAYKQASNLFMADGKLPRGAEQLCKAANAMEPIDVNAAIDLYISAIDLYDQEERYTSSLDVVKKAIGIAVRSRKYARGVELLQRQLTVIEMIERRSHTNKSHYASMTSQVGLSMTVLFLAMDDEVGASKQFNNMCANDIHYSASREAILAETMLKAYDQEDQQALADAVRKDGFSFLDNEIQRLARALRVPGEGPSSLPQGARLPPAAANLSYGSSSAAATPPPPPSMGSDRQRLYGNQPAFDQGLPHYDSAPSAPLPEKGQPYPSELPYHQQAPQGFPAQPPLPSQQHEDDFDDLR
ncbi:TPR-like protein [Hesseltinella vesiculosa]|uniref:Gamma-soluble NSF attachment protein n=1 Tax=Hesseltinella vesiculosa TaxID=101127 RepID=A0A1X2GGI7_9FUNG|nr:TPR-like protein [Hesseltinella vesiculosa]